MDEAYAPPAAQPMLQNPFRPGPALTDQETLPGREAVIDELCALIDSRSPAVLRGPRRAGKTSILHSIERRLTSLGRPVLRVTLEATRVINPDDLALVLVPSLKGDAAPAEAGQPSVPRPSPRTLAPRTRRMIIMITALWAAM